MSYRWAETQTCRPQPSQANACLQTSPSEQKSRPDLWLWGCGDMGASVPSFLWSKWPACERKSSSSIVSRNLREILMCGIVLWHGQTDSSVLDPCKEKLASNLEQMNGNHMQDEEDWVFFSAGNRSLLAPAVSLNNRYEALGKTRECG